ncbi:biotin--[acetyl-CoA-carboxylase] ligase [Candidatus Neomarinimicrobiota bacterium]
MLNIDLIERSLKTHAIGKSILYYDKLDSTNSEALRLDRSKAKHGAVIITDNQENGRGRGTNQWFSVEEKSLTFSVVIFPEFDLNQTGLVAILTGIALSKALESVLLPVQLKWPNDLIINGRKIGGILIDSKVGQNELRKLVIGIGVNVNLEKSDFPKELQHNTTSVRIETGNYEQRESICAKMLNQLEYWLQQVNNPEKIISAWVDKCSHLSKTIKFHHNNELIQGRFIGLTGTGQAKLEVNGIKIAVSSGIIE